MPSATNEEPSYYGSDNQQLQEQSLPSTNVATCSNPTSPSLPKYNDSNGDNDLVPQIYILGNADRHGATSPVLDTNLPDLLASSNGQSSDNSNDTQVAVIVSSQETSSRIIQHNNHHTSNHDNITNRDRNNHHQASASSSPFRIVNKLNNIVTRISKVFSSTSLSSVITTDRCLQEEQPKFAFASRRTLEKTWKLMDKVVKCCQDPRMKLNNSPPFILDILPETFKHLKLIHTRYDSQQPIDDNEYSLVFLRNLQSRCELTLKLFKYARDEIYNEDCEYRHKLTRNTLVFNHILSELRAIFPNGLFIGDKYLITKKESAGEFWKNSFGSNIMVDWKTFYHALQQPWSTLLKNWQTLAVTHPGYKAFLTYDELKARLQKHIDKPGSFVFRLSCTRLGQWAIGYVTQDGQILQTIVQNISLSQALTETEVYVHPDGKDENPELNERVRSGMMADDRNVIVTEEQYEIYCGIGNSFQTCKICFVNDKEIRVEPCNHLLCTSCLLAWQESEGQGCPYCRTEIKETVQITMDLPKSDNKG